MYLIKTKTNKNKKIKQINRHSKGQGSRKLSVCTEINYTNEYDNASVCVENNYTNECEKASVCIEDNYTNEYESMSVCIESNYTNEYKNTSMCNATMNAHVRT